MSDQREDPPKRIWLQYFSEWGEEIPQEEKTWCDVAQDDFDVEYIRADIHQAEIDRLKKFEDYTVAVANQPMPDYESASDLRSDNTRLAALVDEQREEIGRLRHERDDLKQRMSEASICYFDDFERERKRAEKAEAELAALKARVEGGRALWLARDDDGGLYLYPIQPTRLSDGWSGVEDSYSGENALRIMVGFEEIQPGQSCKVRLVREE